MATIYPEVWTGEMVKALRRNDTAQWIDLIPDYSRYVTQGSIIHLIDVGGDPEVLINNTTYPLDVQDLPDGDIAITLNKFQTKPTRITDDELYAIRHDKMASVIERHRAVISEKKYDMALHALAPQTNSASTPVIGTTGTTVNNRKQLIRDDIIKLKKLFDDAKVPVAGRVLVLCSDHVSDLLLQDQKFADQYYNYTTGKIANLYGFQVFEYVSCPYFNGSTLTKNAFGSVPGTGDYQASVAFYAPRMFKAEGDTKAYLSEARNNPTTQENLINFRHYFVALPQKQEAIGAIVSTYVA